MQEWLSSSKEAVKAVNEDKATALHLAASSLRMNVAKLLLEHDAGN